mgnify:CR=1 FL=1
MKLRHNKRRNTAFLFEVLVREMTKSVVEKQLDRKAKIVSIIKEHFGGGTELAKELSLYKTLMSTSELNERVAEKIILEVKRVYTSLNRNKIFDEQSALISKINKDLSKSVYANFVPNYKSLATIAQMFNSEVSAKTRVLLEETLIKRMTREEKAEEAMPRISNLTYRTFVKKFNKEYNHKLHEEQKHLLNNYISSFSDNGIGLKLFLNEELGRIKRALKESLLADEINSDPSMVEKTKKVLDLLESYKQERIDKKTLHEILKIQNLVREIQT